MIYFYFVDTVEADEDTCERFAPAFLSTRPPSRVSRALKHARCVCSSYHAVRRQHNDTPPPSSRPVIILLQPSFGKTHLSTLCAAVAHTLVLVLVLVGVIILLLFVVHSLLVTVAFEASSTLSSSTYTDTFRDGSYQATTTTTTAATTATTITAPSEPSRSTRVPINRLPFRRVRRRFHVCLDSFSIFVRVDLSLSPKEREKLEVGARAAICEQRRVCFYPFLYVRRYTSSSSYPWWWWSSSRC